MKPLAKNFRKHPETGHLLGYGLWIELNNELWGRVLGTVIEGYITVELTSTLSRTPK